MKKKLFILCLICASALMAAACGGKEQAAQPAEAAATEAEASEEPAQEEQPEGETAEGTDTQAEEQKDEAPPQEGQSVTGKVTDGTMNAVTIEDEDGKEYSFPLEGADSSGLADGILIGNKVTVVYEGDLESTDPTELKTISISDAK